MNSLCFLINVCRFKEIESLAPPLWNEVGGRTLETRWAERCKEPACQGTRHGFDPWVGKIPWRRKWHPFQYSYLGNPMDRGAWRATGHAVAETWTRLSTCACTHHRDGPSPSLVPLTASQPSEAGRTVRKAARPPTELPAAGVLPTRCPLPSGTSVPGAAPPCSE